jgi:hypothetical protein
MDANQRDGVSMEFPDIDILDACAEAEKHQQELLPLLASALGVPPEDVFYTWAFRRCKQHGDLPDTPWCFFFHGLECDLKNSADGRFLRLDFGPRGRLDTISAWGALQFIMTSVAPWPDYAALKQLFADKEPPYDQYSGNLHRFGEYWDRLEAQGCFETTDQGLVEFEAQYAAVGPSGIRTVRFPPETPEQTQIDCLVAHRTYLSAHARRLVETHRAQLTGR